MRKLPAGIKAQNCFCAEALNYIVINNFLFRISLCAKIGYMYYCEYAHLLKKRTEHTCMFAICYDQESEIKAINVKL